MIESAVLVAEGALEVLVLTCTDARAWAYWPIGAKRVADFCVKYDTDADPMLMVAQLRTAFVQPKSNAYILLLLEDGNVIGHLLVTLEEWFGTRIASIVQYELDKTIPRSMANETLRCVEDWARQAGAAFVQCMARNEAVARTFSTYFNFKRERVMLRKSLSTDVASASDLA